MIIEAVSDRQTLWHQPIHWCVHGHWCTLISLLSHSDTYYFNETHGSLAEITGITKDHNFCQNFSPLSHSLSVSMHRFTLSQPCTKHITYWQNTSFERLPDFMVKLRRTGSFVAMLEGKKCELYFSILFWSRSDLYMCFSLIWLW